jgi:hypothetical protein
MNKPGKPVNPVKPGGMELVFMYACPYCRREMPILAPVSPTVIRCDVCKNTFPIIPVEEKTVAFVKLMLANGVSAIDVDFM